MGKTKKRKANHATKVTKIPKTKRQKYGMNETYVIYECSLRPRWMHAADSSGCPPRDPFSTISLSSLIPKRLEAVTSDQCRADPSSKMPAIAFWHTTFQFSFSPYGLPVISMTQLLTHSVAHSTRPSSRPKTNNRSIKKFLKSCGQLSKSCQKLVVIKVF